MTEENFKKKFVVDTSLFLTQHVRKNGESMEEAIDRITGLIINSRDQGPTCFMPPSTHDELLDITENKVSDEVHQDLKTSVIRKGPKRYDIKVSGEFMHDFIEEMRKRVDKGLRLSEKALRELEDMEEEPDHDYYSQSDVVISKLRDNYKEALRKGILDSREDLDLLLLARELNATVVTEDNGVLNWADEFGLRSIKGRDFPDFLQKQIE